MTILTELEALEKKAKDELAAIGSGEELEALRVAYLGRKGALTGLMKQLGGLPIEEKRELGPKMNRFRDDLTARLEDAKERFENEALAARLAQEKEDITRPPRPRSRGAIHPISEVIEEIITIFADLGFSVAEGPEIEDDFHNFTALNIPESHPARAMHDTFYLEAEDESGRPFMLRTHTSPVQIRSMCAGTPPFRLIAPGPTYRSDSDQTHTPMFHQVEGLAIDRDLHMGQLKWVLQQFVDRFFGQENIPMRFRASFFPFTEPSAEVDIGCTRADGQVRIGEGADWLEILGCGMVHPNVLKACELDPGEWQGFAFGMGIERLAMLKYGMSDLRDFFQSDARWLRHYGMAPAHVPSLSGSLDG